MTDHDFGFRNDFYTFAPETLRQELVDFDILREVGKGSMGIVYEAVRKSDRKRVALKVLPPSLTLTERALARFLKEGSVLARIEHEHIVKVFQHGRQGRLHYFCMEFVDGTTLAQRLAIGPLPLRQAAEIAAAIARALQYAHDHGVLHRDVKPGNLMLRHTGGVAITDFGLAHEAGTGSLTESGAIIGTPMYMAPEQILGDKHTVDARADVYGLGATLYEMVTGRPPFEGPTAQSVLKAVLETDAPRPQQSRRDLPVALQAIIMQAIEKDAARRYGSAVELAEDLERFLAGERPLARLPSLPNRLGRNIRKRPLLWTLIAVIAILASLSLLLFYDKRRQDLEGRLREIAIDFNQATSLDTMSLRPLTAQERTALLQRARQRATAVFETAPGAMITAVPALIWRARIHNALHAHERAVEDLDLAQKMIGGKPRQDILTYRIATLEKLGTPLNRARLQEDLTNLLALDPGGDTQILVVDHLLLIAGATAGVDRVRLLTEIESILSRFRGSDGTNTARWAIAEARLLELQGRLQEAEQSIQAVIEKNPTDPVGYTHAARIYRLVDKPRAALAAQNMARALSGEAAAVSTTSRPEAGSTPRVDMEAVTEFLRGIEKVTQATAAGKEGEAPTSRRGPGRQ